MRPIRLSIGGLHSFREPQTIDFTRLTEYGIFGIFGPTGSGKSTILDAITLALYGDVGRAGRNTQAIVNHGERRLEVSFDFAIGAPDQRQHYRVQRAYRRGNGFSVEHQQSRLLSLEAATPGNEEGRVVIADSKAEVDLHIRQIIGLEKSDFTRAVVLPQGKFAEFLQLTGTERNAMTERLFGLERFGKLLVDHVTAKARAVTEEQATLLASQRELGDASASALTAAETAMAAARQVLRRAEETQDAARERMRIAEQVHELTRQQEEATAQLAMLSQRSADVARMRQSLQRHHQAAAVSPVVAAWRTAAAALEHARLEADGCTARWQQAQAELQAAQERLSQAESNREQLEPDALRKQGRLQDALELEAQLLAKEAEGGELQANLAAASAACAQLRGLHEAARVDEERSLQQRSAAERALAEHATSPEQRLLLEELRAAQSVCVQQQAIEQRERAQLQERSARHGAVAAAASAAQAQVEALRAAERTLVAEREQLQARKPTLVSADLHFCERWLDAVTARVGRLSAAQREVAVASEQLQQQQAQRLNLELAALAKQMTADRLQQAWRDMLSAKTARAASEETALVAQLASRLCPGDPCPVCGSRQHPQSAAPPVGASGGALAPWTADEEQALVAAQACWHEADGAVRQVQTEVATAQASVILLQQHVDRQQHGMAEAQLELTGFWPPPSHLSPTQSAPTDADQWQSLLATAGTMVEQLSSALQAWQLEQEDLASREGQRAQQAQAAEQACSLAQGRADAALQEMTRQQQRVQEVVADRTQAARALASALAPLAGPTERLQERSDEETVALAESRISRAREDDRVADEAQTTVVRLNVQVSQAQTRVAAVAAELQQAEAVAAAHSVQLDQVRTDVGQRRQQLQQLTDGLPVQAALAQVEAQLVALREAQRQAMEAVQTAHTHTQRQAQAAARGEAERDAQTALADAERARMDDALARQQFATAQAVADALLSEEELDFQAAAVADHEAHEQRWQQRQADVRAELAGRSMDDDTWTALRSALAAAEAAYRAAAADSGSIQERLADVERRRTRWQALEGRRLDVAALSGRLTALQTCLRANAFVQYVAREQMESVARQASSRLAELTHGRYALALADDGNFLMQDNHNGGALRPVSTLSGGETFLTSLALALALSTHIQLRGQHPLEFFFLDEGFGTLDPDLLDLVISSLERLHADQLAIGLISHVPELRQRLPRRLLVEPALPAGRGTRVYVEVQ